MKHRFKRPGPARRAPMSTATLRELAQTRIRILENDPLFASNMAMLMRRRSQGKITEHQSSHVWGWLVNDTLRRNGVPRKTARVMLRASC